jgi:uncharacterized protein
VRAGLISDTHGLLDPKLPELFRGCDLIVHGGDVVKAAVLEALERIAPVRAVRGNNDEGLPGLGELPETLVVPLGELAALVIHDIGARGRPSPAARRALARHRCPIVVHGHSHRPAVQVADGVLFVNPGAAGPRRFSPPLTAGLLEVAGRRARVALFDLGGAALAPFGAPSVHEL